MSLIITGDLVSPKLLEWRKRGAVVQAAVRAELAVRAYWENVDTEDAEAGQDLCVGPE